MEPIALDHGDSGDENEDEETFDGWCPVDGSVQMKIVNANLPYQTFLCHICDY